MVVGVEHVIRIIYHAKLFLLGMYHHGYFILCHNIHVLFLSPQSSLFKSGLVLETPPRKPRTHQCGEWTHSHWFAEKSFGIRSGSSHVHVPFMEVLFWDPEPFYLSAESVLRGSFLHLQKRLHVGERARKRHDLIGCEKAETVCDAFIGHDRVVRHSVVLEGHSKHELVT